MCRRTDDFGIHRTAHDGDLRTSDWLAERFRALGLETSEHSLSLRQFNSMKRPLKMRRVA